MKSERRIAVFDTDDFKKLTFEIKWLALIYCSFIYLRFKISSRQMFVYYYIRTSCWVISSISFHFIVFVAYLYTVKLESPLCCSFWIAVFFCDMQIVSLYKIFHVSVKLSFTTVKEYEILECSKTCLFLFREFYWRKILLIFNNRPIIIKKKK